MNRSILRATAAIVLTSALSVPAFAHMTLETREAPAGAGYKAVLRIPHGCGDAATTTVRVQIPEGYHSVKPMPHAGWELSTTTGAYENTYNNHGREVSEGVTEVVWSGGNLPNAHYDEFAMNGSIGADIADGTTLYFKSVQECENGETEEWIGTAGEEGVSPAPKLVIKAAETGHDHGHDHGAHAGHDMATSATVTFGDLEISDAYARATLPNAPVGGGFISITNNGSEDDVLVSATSEVAGDVQLHNMKVENDVMQMYEMEDGIPLPAGETVTLAPGGLHIMFMQLKESLVEGEKVKVSLNFEKAGPTDIMLDIRGIGAGGANNHGHEGMAHGH